MKITFIQAGGLSLCGGDRAIAIYAEGLQERGHEVLVVARCKPQSSLKQQIVSLLSGGGWIPRVNNLSPSFSEINFPYKVIEKSGAITDADVPDADVVIATWWETAEWVAKLSPSKGAKAYFVQHHEVFDYLPKERVKFTWLLPLYKIAVSKWLVDVAGNEYGDQNISLVPNSVNTEQFYAPPRGKQNIPTVGMMYSGVYWKGCDLSLKAFEIATKEIPNLRLIAFGTTEPLSILPLPANSEYVCNPPQNHLKDFYAKCDAWLFGSREEGFGLPILEAMACQTPVIGTPAGAAPELLAGGGGILVEPENPEAMAKAIVKICKMSDGEWQAMSELAYAQATSYTWDNAIDLFEKALYTTIERWQHSNFF
jgi:glycosyltransferase involved in cell wall biosynthesis